MEAELARRLRDATLVAAIDDAVRDLESSLREDLRAAAVRRHLRDDFVLDWDGVRLQSLWLVVHRGLRRAGLRLHPDSTVLLVAWKRPGLVLLRASGARGSRTLVPWDAAEDLDGDRAVLVPAGTPYDTLAENRNWPLLAVHSHPVAGLQRRQQVWRDQEEVWLDLSEEEPS